MFSNFSAGPGMSGSRSSHPVQQQKLTDSNVGHKLLQKMGSTSSDLLLTFEWKS